jgi:hypothetical protein
MPIVRKNQLTSAQRRTAASQSVSSLRVISAAIANAKGTVVATRPR